MAILYSSENKALFMLIPGRKILLSYIIFSILCMVIFVLVVFACQPFARITKVSTDSYENLTPTSCLVKGTVVDIGEEGIIQHGHCWSVNPNPNISNDKTEKGTRDITGAFSSDLLELVPDQKYYVKAYAVDHDGEYYGREISFTTPPVTVPVPLAPSDLVATAVSKNQINLSWSDKSDNEEGFKIERSPDGTNWVEIAVVGAGITSFQNTGLSAATEYFYRVRAFNPGGHSAFSNPANAATFADIPVPEAPTGLAADAESTSQITINWTDNSSNEEGFIIERSLDSISWDVRDTVETNIYSYLDINLEPGTAYFYKVRAYNAGGNSDYSNPAKAITFPDVERPFAPADLIAEAVSDVQINLTWSYSAEYHNGFIIERSQDNITWDVIHVLEDPGARTYQDRNLNRSSLYYYRVRAFNAAGDSDPSDPPAFAETFLCPTSLLIDHVAGDGICPVTISIRYGVVESDLTGEHKCWITRNLGAEFQASAPGDPTNEAAGWYWQFNRLQGYQFDEGVRTPDTEWMNNPDVIMEWAPENDPCRSLLGPGWRIPTEYEWRNVLINSGWTNFYDSYASELKIHGAGELGFMDGILYGRGSYGTYWSRTAINDEIILGNRPWLIQFLDNDVKTDYGLKESGHTIRCLKD